MNFWNNLGLLNLQPDLPGDVYEENCLLATAEYLFLLKQNNLPYENVLIDFVNYVEFCRVGSGLFLQVPNKPNDKTSHDQITAICSVSKEFGLPYHKEIWKALKKQTGRYDVVSPDSPKWSDIQHPRDILYYGYLAGNPFCKLLIWLLWIIQLISCIERYKYRGGDLNSDSCKHNWIEVTPTEFHCKYCGLKRFQKTDGKLLAWLRCKTLKWDWTLAFYEKAISYFAGFSSWIEVFKAYFHPNHPIRKIFK